MNALKKDCNELARILEEFIKKGITQVRDVGGPFNVLKKMKEDINSNKIKGPEIFYAGPMLEKSPLHWEKFNEKLPGFTVQINTKKDVDKIIIQLKENKASLIKTFNKFDKVIYQYLAEQSKEISIPITHDPGFPLFQFIPIDLAIDFGIKCFEKPFSAFLTLDSKYRILNRLQTRSKGNFSITGGNFKKSL